jgi:hypothetical protein
MSSSVGLSENSAIGALVNDEAFLDNSERTRSERLAAHHKNEYKILHDS